MAVRSNGHCHIPADAEVGEAFCDFCEGHPIVFCMTNGVYVCEKCDCEGQLTDHETREG